MKNSINKVVAGVICGLIIGSIGTSLLGNFEINNQQTISSANQNNQNSENNLEHQNEGNSSYEQYGNMPQPPDGMNRMDGKRGGHHHRGEGSLEATDSIDISDGQYTDGVYEGTASGYAQGLNVQVTISSGKISNIEIVNHNETPGFYENAFNTVPSEIIQNQSTDVDTVSGATYSSVGIINAVNNALSKASKTQNTTTQ